MAKRVSVDGPAFQRASGEIRLAVYRLAEERGLTSIQLLIVLATAQTDVLKDMYADQRSDD